MSRKSQEEITDADISRVFLEPANPTQRQYEAFRAYFVEGIPSAEAAKRFGYTAGSFRVPRVSTRPAPLLLPSRAQGAAHLRQAHLRTREGH